MKKIFTILLVVLVVASLAGCADNASAGKKPEETTVAESHETVAPTESETESSVTEPDLDDSSLTPPEVDAPAIVEKYDNPGDDPRMIVQIHWQQGDIAFIDDYNLIGYISGKENILYYIDENKEYIPAPGDALRFYTPPAAEDLIEYEYHLGTLDLDAWIGSLGVNLVRADVDAHDIVCLELADETRISFDHNSVTYRVKTADSYMFWSFHTPLGRTNDMLYATFNGEKIVIGHDMEILWVLEKGLNMFKNDLAENPW